MAGTCFVVQGFGKKTDYRTGRVLDLDASYEVIKEAVEEAGLRCVRADEIQHAGVIDKPMYEQILNADLVVADLSTSNVNAAYELGVRHALRPRTTIIVAEKQWHFEFDMDRNAIRTYEHLGPDLGRREAEAFKKALSAAIKEIIAQEDAIDSPLYTFIPELAPPAMRAAHAAAPAPGGEAIVAAAAAAPAPDEQDPSVRVLTEQAKAALAKGDFVTAKALFGVVHEKRPSDPYVVQQMALATYKSQQPTPEEALREAGELLASLTPQVTHDPETLGLWGAVHKRLWDRNKQVQDLGEAVSAYERGFYLRRDYYNGINLAFLLNVRAREALKAGDKASAVADFVQARRVRKQVSEICVELLEAGPQSADDKYWILATLWEAAVGLDDKEAAASWEKKAEQVATAPWMLESTRDQLRTLKGLLEDSPLALLK